MNAKNYPAMEATAIDLVVPGKGILAVDESGPTIEKRFREVGLVSTAETRRAYREMLLETPGLGAFISGAILHDETIRQTTVAGQSFVALLTAAGIIPGIKVDLGAKAFAGFPGEKITEGLDGLRERLAEYAGLGARFAKWRAVLTVGPHLPTRTCLEANMQALAHFAGLSQEAGLVPVVEPEVLMDGEHTLARHFEVTEIALQALFRELFTHRVHQEALLLKVNMVLAGTTCPTQATVEEVSQATRLCLLHTVPAAVPGIVFLSGGQADVRATEHLDALNRLGKSPWELSFSFGRALQAPALREWAKSPGEKASGQRALLRRARCNSAARFGCYLTGMEVKAA